MMREYHVRICEGVEGEVPLRYSTWKKFLQENNITVNNDIKLVTQAAPFASLITLGKFPAACCINSR